MTRAAVDAGRAGWKRVGAGLALRLAGASSPAACAAWARRDVPDLSELAVVAPTEAAARELEAALSKAEPGLRVTALAAPLATALALTPATPAPADGAIDAVLDLGHDALRLSLVRWHRLGDEAFPRLEAAVAADTRPLGGGRLDAALLGAATVEGGAASALKDVAAHELKELVGAGRGPWVRAWDDHRSASSPAQTGVPPVVARLTAGAGARAVTAFAAELEGALAELTRRAVAAGARRALVTGGLLHLLPARRAAERALGQAGGALEVVLADEPLFTAARGALRALDRPASPTAREPLRVALRDGRGVVAREVVPLGAALPGRFGPIRVRATKPAPGPGGAPPAAPPALLVLEGERLLEAKLALPAGEAPADVWLAWEFGRGWTAQVGDAPGASLAPAPAARAQAVRDALAFDWSAHSQAVPVDLAFVFRATQGGGDAVLRPMGAAITAMAASVVMSAPDVRLRGIAVGDHPQGHLKPAYVTKVQPGWVGRTDELGSFVGERLAAPVDGIDAPEAYEVGLKDAGALDWRADAEKLLVVLADVPPHTPDQPPFCPVDWKVEARRLREKGVRVVPVHVAIGGVPPQLRRQALAFLEGLADRVESLRAAQPGPELVATLQAAATTRRMDPAARRVLEAIGLSQA